ncbi:catalase : Catalase OS=Rhodomicrobium vannielii (strain ATCC 17100 / ATH 3.1.1 / DSM 162 / LMG 4299) GN=Rvan_0122 PE=3 SV=1: Catalase: Catalase-rel [Gemmataceae bacterium]|nr:catalase : Catalase OS=Rhodomicrobium vannielii (strain ATCC 17100 / ATH 3.1.1 / DSM 162 / LMG 4299) GN=Rvan_0122 PE=3 SV=1: Catalase: Catalase-rel [Gemmataceae bacterium]VTT97719.1 catalase : Catalase OS=Rhodomicrobium vannielii (strain ATCC 17100 / ATH 3.1.1 / DSM 162 / LMG 4299) GN=Rvan_0122 PE=3 SV=1: Catalase: Catalase-rel [Gemmataceae bacterium]
MTQPKTSPVENTGGETHQTAGGKSPVLTTQQGVPVSDDQNTLRAGPRGPALLEDFHFREKMFHFDHERIPERVVHARGYGAHGYFESNGLLEAASRAAVFKKGEKTPAFVRFSTVAGNKGSADLGRDVRGFATKFYTKEGNWDLVGNNIPVFFIQDPIKFPDMVHAFKDEPDRGFPQAQTAHDNAWDFISLTPESMHMVMWVMSDRAIPRSFRFMEGFGVHTFRLVTAEGKSTFVKFHWKPKLGLQSVVWNEAVKINGADPDFHRRDLWDAIEQGAFPEWELGVQLFDDAFADKFAFDVLDPTKIIPEEEVPVQVAGRLVLDRNVDNFFLETEQVAFCTQNVVPGIDFTNDPLLQGRNFSYLDTQLKRLGSPNFTHIPINAPKCPVMNFQQDGHMAMRNPKGRVNYEPNSWSGATPREEPGPRESHAAGYRSFPAAVEGTKVRQRSETFADHYSQARQFYVSQTDIEKQHIQNALVFELSKVNRVDIRARMVGHLLNIDQGLADAVVKGLRLKDVPKPLPAARPTRQDLKPSDKLSIIKNGPKNFAGRKVGALVTDGTDADVLAALDKAVKAEGATLVLVAPEVGGFKDSAGASHDAHEKLEGGPSVLFDAVAVIPSKEGAALLAELPAARDFVADAYAHRKFVGYSPAAAALFEKAGVARDEGFVPLGKAGEADAFIAACRKVRFWGRAGAER